MVRDIRDCCPIRGETIRERGSGMIEVLGLYQDVKGEILYDQIPPIAVSW